MRGRTTLLLATALVGLAGCSNSPPSSGPRATPAATERPGRRPSGRATGHKTAPARSPKAHRRGTGSSPAPAATGPAPARGEGGKRRARPARSPGAPSTSSRSDLRGDGDSHGSTPGYTDIVGASVTGSRDGVELVLEVAGPIPGRMPDGDTSMTGTFKLSTDRGDHDVHFTADANGWTAGIDHRRFEGTFRIHGDRFVVTLPWSAVASRSFDWIAQSAWTSSSSGETYYRFDDVPDDGTASFPE